MQKLFKFRNSIIIFIVLIFVFSVQVALPVEVDSLKIQVQPKELTVTAGESSYILLKIQIPKDLYIYGNPKGPGVGRPTSVTAEAEGFVFKSPVFQLPEKHTPAGFDQFVWIYKNKTEIKVPFAVSESIKPGIYKIKIFFNALMCSSKACYAQDYTLEVAASALNPASSQIKDNSSSGNGAAKSKEAVLKAGDLSMFKSRYLSPNGVSNILQAIFYGILAGFILNFMPCVLPVIGLKIMDIVRHSSENRRELAKLSLIFTAGILTTFTVLAALAAFMGYGFGELFQKKIFIVSMIAVIFALSLTLFDVFSVNFKIPVFSRRKSDHVPLEEITPAYEISNIYLDTFWKGVLTTLLATPCSGPFLGGTLAWSFTQKPPVVFLIFISIGIGMSMPYLIIIANPGLLKFIPRPGQWMVTFERIMGFLLLGTVIYLIGILETHLVVPTLWFLFITGIALWQYGKYGSLIMKKSNRMISRLVLVVMILCGYFAVYHFFYSDVSQLEIIRNEFSVSRLYANKHKGVVSVVDFTADWCPNCKLVEKTSLFTAKIAELAEDGKIDICVADMTRNNAEAEAMLKQLGSRSIPFLAVFPSNENEFFQPVCLRDIYSEADLVKAIEMAKGF